MCLSSGQLAAGFLLLHVCHHFLFVSATKIRQPTPVTTTTSASSSSSQGYYDDIPWQDSAAVEDVIEASRYEDIYDPTIFSPSGRVHCVESAMKASKLITPRSNIVIAIQCQQGLVVMSTIPTSAFLNTTATTTTTISNQNDTTINDDESKEPQHNNENNPNTTTTKSKFHQPLFLVNETCTTTRTNPILDLSLKTATTTTNNDDDDDGGHQTYENSPLLVATGGNAVDGHVLRHKILQLQMARMQQEEELFDNKNNGVADNTIPTTPAAQRLLAKDIANTIQQSTQYSYVKDGLPLLASSAVIVGNDEIWRIDPTGQFWNCHVAVIGQDANHIEEKLYETLLEKYKSTTLNDVTTYKGQQFSSSLNAIDLRSYLNSISSQEALQIAKQVIEDQLQDRWKVLASLTQALLDLEESLSSSSSKMKESTTTKTLLPSSPVPVVHWEAVIIDSFESSSKGKKGKRYKKSIHRGTIFASN